MQTNIHGQATLQVCILWTFKPTTKDHSWIDWSHQGPWDTAHHPSSPLNPHRPHPSPPQQRRNCTCTDSWRQCQDTIRDLDADNSNNKHCHERTTWFEPDVRTQAGFRFFAVVGVKNNWKVEV